MSKCFGLWSRHLTSAKRTGPRNHSTRTHFRVSKGFFKLSAFEPGLPYIAIFVFDHYFVKSLVCIDPERVVLIV